jgi:serine/threonine-protein kinase
MTIRGRTRVRTPGSGGVLEEIDRILEGLRAPRGGALSRFETGPVLGRGGAGVVVRARDLDLDRDVAIKLLREDAAASPVVRERFQREARLMASLSHPNIVTVFDAGEEQGRLYLVMELVGGSSLADLLGMRDLRTLVGWVEQAARGVAAAHEAGVIHRDLKPGNILVGKNGSAKVADFGLARLEDSPTAMTATGAQLGTPHYMAPEQVEGRADARSDVYGLGAVLYEAITGRPPFSGSTMAEITHRILNQDPVTPRSLRSTVPRDLETIALKALEKRPARRYRSARDFAEDLRLWLAGEPIRARRPGAIERMVRSLSRRKVGVAAAGALLAVVAVAVGLTIHFRSRTFAEASAEARAEHRRGRWDRALSAAERALSVRGDPELSRLAEDCRSRLRVEERRRRLLSRLAPIEERLRAIHLLTYAPEADVPAELSGIDRSIAEVRALAEEFGEFAEVWTALGMAQHMTGDLAGSKEALERAAALSPDEPRANFFLGRLLLELTMSTLRRGRESLESRQRRAEEYAARAAGHLARADAAPGASDPIGRDVLQGYVLVARRKLDELAEHARAALARHPKGLGREEFWIFLAEAGRGRERIEACTQALACRPHYAWALLARGTAHMDLGDLESAAKDYDEAIRLAPRRADAWARRADLHHARGNLDGAWADATEAVRLDPEPVTARYIRGRVRIDQKRWDEAIQEYAEVIRLAPDLAWPYFRRGFALAERGDYGEARADLDRAIALDPKFPEFFNQRGNVRYREGDYDGAIADYGEAIRLDAKYVFGYLNRGVVWWSRGRLDLALADYEKAVVLDPRMPDAWGVLGELRFSNKDYQGAAEACTRYLELRPGDPKVRFVRARARRNLGDRTGSLEDFTESIRLDPAFHESYYYRGLLRADLGDPAGAVEDLKTAVRLAPTDWPRRAHAEQVLEELRK